MGIEDISDVAAESYLPGIDISHHQGTIDWKAVAADGIAFAFAKATDGIGSPDSQFQKNWAAMKAQGITRGAYHFFRPLRSPEAQAAEFLARFDHDFSAGDLAPMLDLEEANDGSGHDTWSDVPPETRVPSALKWLETVEQALGVAPIIYTRAGWVADWLQNKPGGLAAYPLWIVHYKAAPPKMPVGWDQWSIWQYSEKGTVPGVNGSVDLDRFNGTISDIAKLTK